MAVWTGELETRFVYASSAATYGAIEGEVFDSIPLRSLRPLNAYAFSKQLFDLWAERTGLLKRAAGLKYFNVFGPNEAHKGDMRSMVCRAFEQIQRTGTVRLFRSEGPEFRDGEQLRDFLYIKDAVSMTLYLMASPSAVGLFNIGSGTAHTWLDLVAAVFDACEVARRVEFIDMPERLKAKYQCHTCANIWRLREAGYDRDVPELSAAVSDYVRAYLIPDCRLGDELPSA